MRRFLMIALVLPIFAVVGCAEQVGGISVDNAYSFATSATQKNGVVGGIIRNNGARDIVIVSARGDVSERIELHTHLHENGVMKMRQVESYTIPANGALTLGPMGEHVMLMGLKQKFNTGDAFTIQLIDSNDGVHDVNVLVRAPGDMP